MKRREFLRSGALAAATGAAAAVARGAEAGAATPAVEKELVALEKRAWEAWRKKDADFFKGFFSGDSVIVSAAGVVAPAALLAAASDPDCSLGDFSLDNFKVVALNADTAILTFRALQSAACGGAAAARPDVVWASTVYVRRGGKWLSAFHQQTTAAPAE